MYRTHYLVMGHGTMLDLKHGICIMPMPMHLITILLTILASTFFWNASLMFGRQLEDLPGVVQS